MSDLEKRVEALANDLEAAGATPDTEEYINGRRSVARELRALLAPREETSARDEDGGWHDTTVRPMEGENK